MDTPPPARRIVFVGAGPRAIALADRIGAHAHARGMTPPMLVLIDPHPAGAGRVWATDQPRTLLNNTSAADTTVFCDDTIRSSAPIDSGPSLYEWCLDIGRDHPDRSVRSESAGIRAWTKPPRALQGAYYRWALQEVADRHRSSMRIVERRAVVERVVLGESPRVELQDGTTVAADAVVVTMGFVDDAPADDEAAFARFGRAHGRRYRAPGIVDAHSLDGFDLDAPILIRGLGATLFDLLGLVESSRRGTAPALLAIGSATGLPKRAQPDGAGPPVGPHRLSETVAASWIERHGGRASGDAEELWAILHADLADAFERHASRLPGGTPGATRFDWSEVAHPRWDGSEPFARTVERFFAQESMTIDEPDRSPWAAVRRAVLELRPRVLALLGAGVLAPQDGAWIRDRFLRPAGRLTSGPPAQRQMLLRRWHDAGRVDLIGPDATFSTRGEVFSASSPARATTIEASQLFEARQAFGSVDRSASPVIRSLVRDGHGRAAASGGLLVDAQDHRLLSEDGTPAPCWVAGHLARSTQAGVNQGAIPRSGDPFLQESDALAASIVRSLA